MHSKFPGTAYVWLIRGIFGMVAISVLGGYLYYTTTAPIPIADKDKIIARYSNIDDILQFHETKLAETAWISRLPEGSPYVYAPLGPLPCPQPTGDGVDATVQAALTQAQTGDLPAAIAQLTPLTTGNTAHWLPVLTQTLLQAQAGNYPAATRSMDTFFTVPDNSGNVLNLYEIRRRSPRATVVIAGNRVRATEQHLNAFLHLEYNRGTLMLQQGHYGPNLMEPLRHAVGLAKRLFRWGNNGDRIRHFPIEAPQCPSNPRDLTTSDIYNNLIVGYLLRKTFAASATSETQRQYPDDNLLYAPLRFYRNNTTVPVHWLWALSNAEHVLHSIPDPGSPLLRYTIATVIDSVIKLGYTDNLSALQTKRQELLDGIRWPDVPELQRPSMLSGQIKATLMQGQAIPTDLRHYLDPQQQQVVNALAYVKKQQADRERWQHIVTTVMATGTSSGAINNTLGDLAPGWLRGIRRDLAIHLVQQASADRIKTWQIANIIRGFITTEDGYIPGLDSLHYADGDLFQLGTWVLSWQTIPQVLLAIIYVLPILLLGLWLAAQYRQWMILFGSLYQIESNLSY